MHPCYLINWLTEVPLTEQAVEIRFIVNAIFGRRELINNRRIVSTLVVVASEVLKRELRIKSVKEVANTFRNDSTFKTLFYIIYESQTQNLHFNRCVIKYLLDTFLLPKIRESIANKKKVDFKSKISDIRDEALKYMDVQLRKGIEKSNQTQSWSESDLLSDEILSLINHTYQVLTSHARSSSRGQPDEKGGDEQAESDDFIKPYLLDLLFGNLLRQMASLDVKKLNFEFCTLDYNDRDKQFKKYFKILH